MSLLCADTPDFSAMLGSANIQLLWHPSLSLESGAEIVDVLERCIDGRTRLDVLCLEGAVMRGPQGTGLFHVLAGTGTPMMTWIERLAKVAQHVVAIGSCAAWGGFSRTPQDDTPAKHQTQAEGLQYVDDAKGGLLGADFRAQAGLPVINISGCPVHPSWVTDTLMGLANQSLDSHDLDGLQRPRFYADQLVHHGCTRNEYYEFKASAEKPSDLGCMMEHMGCKGTQAHADCNTRLWNGEGSCTRGGYACISCTEPGFQQPGHAYHATPKIAGIPIGLPIDMPKAWFVALASLSKSATPKRVKTNATSDHLALPPQSKRTTLPSKSRSKEERST